MTGILLTALPTITYAKSFPYIGLNGGVQNTKGYNGLMTTLLGGYGLITGKYENYYFAGELFADSGTLPLGKKYYRRTNYGFGASITPGLILRETVLIYLRIGIETFRYSTELNWFTGGQLGLGIQSSIAGNWDMRGEYVYTGEGIYHHFGNARFNFFKIGIIYKFT